MSRFPGPGRRITSCQGNCGRCRAATKLSTESLRFHQAACGPPGFFAAAHWGKGAVWDCEGMGWFFRWRQSVAFPYWEKVPIRFWERPTKVDASQQGAYYLSFAAP